MFGSPTSGLLGFTISQISFLSIFPRLFLSELLLANIIRCSAPGLARSVYSITRQPILIQKAGLAGMRVEKTTVSSQRFSFAPFCQQAVVIGFLSSVLEPIREEPDS